MPLRFLIGEKMKRKFKFIIVNICIITFVFGFCVTGYAVEENIDEYAEEYDFESVVGSVSDETAELLAEIGMDDISFEKIFNVEVSKVFDVLFDMSKKALSEPLEFLVSGVGIIILTSLIASLVKSAETVWVIGASVLALTAAVPIAEMITTAFSVLETLFTFTTSFTGVFAALVSSSGNIALGTSYASLAVVSDTVFSALLFGVGQPAVNAMCALGFLSCFDIYSFSAKLSATVKKIYISFLGFVATLFSGIVTLKGVMGAGADSITSRGVRFVVGRSLPVVGGAVSETYSALVSSLSLIKNTVGVFGIATVVLTVLPSLMQILGWVAVLSLTVTVSEFLDSKISVGMLNILKDTLTLLGVTIVFSGVIFVVSVGVVIFVKGV